MFAFWKPAWYEDKSDEFLKMRYERKPFALTFIICATVFFVIALTRLVIGRPLGLLIVVITTCLMVVGCVWFRIAYLSQEELKRRGDEDAS